MQVCVCLILYNVLHAAESSVIVNTSTCYDGETVGSSAVGSATELAAQYSFTFDEEDGPQLYNILYTDYDTYACIYTCRNVSSIP